MVEPASQLRVKLLKKYDSAVNSTIIARILGQEKYLISAYNDKLRIFNYNDNEKLFYLRQIQYDEPVLALSKFSPPGLGADWLLIGFQSNVKVVGFSHIDHEFEVASLDLPHFNQNTNDTHQTGQLAQYQIHVDPENHFVTIYTVEGDIFTYKLFEARTKSPFHHLKKIHKAEDKSLSKIFNKPSTMKCSAFIKDKEEIKTNLQLLNLKIKLNKEGVPYYSMVLDKNGVVLFNEITVKLRAGVKFDGNTSSMDSPVNAKGIVAVVDEERPIVFTQDGFVLYQKYLDTDLPKSAEKRRLDFNYNVEGTLENIFVEFTFKHGQRTCALLDLTDDPNQTSVLIVDETGSSKVLTIKSRFNSLDQLLKWTKIRNLKGQLPSHIKKILMIQQDHYIAVNDLNCTLFTLKDDTIEIKQELQMWGLVQRETATGSFFPSYRSWKIDSKYIILGVNGFETYRFDKSGVIRTSNISPIAESQIDLRILDMKKIKDNLVIVTEKGIHNSDEFIRSLNAAYILDDGSILYHSGHFIYLNDKQYSFPEAVSVLRNFKRGDSDVILAGTVDGLVVEIEEETETQTIVFDGISSANDLLIKVVGDTYYYIISDISSKLHIVNAIGETQGTQMGRTPIRILDYGHNEILAYNETHIMRVIFDKDTIKRSIYTDFEDPIKLLLYDKQIKKVALLDGTRFKVFDRSFLNFYGFNKLKRKSKELK